MGVVQISFRFFRVTINFLYLSLRFCLRLDSIMLIYVILLYLYRIKPNHLILVLFPTTSQLYLLSSCFFWTKVLLITLNTVHLHNIFQFILLFFYVLSVWLKLNLYFLAWIRCSNFTNTFCKFLYLLSITSFFIKMHFPITFGILFLFNQIILRFIVLLRILTALLWLILLVVIVIFLVIIALWI